MRTNLKFFQTEQVFHVAHLPATIAAAFTDYPFGPCTSQASEQAKLWIFSTLLSFAEVNLQRSYTEHVPVCLEIWAERQHNYVLGPNEMNILLGMKF